LHSPAVGFPQPSNAVYLEPTFEWKAQHRNAARLHYQSAVTRSVQDVEIPSCPRDRSACSWRYIPPDFRSNIPAPAITSEIRENASRNLQTPAKRVKKTAAWDAWFVPDRFNQTSTSPRPHCSRFRRPLSTQEFNALENSPTTHPVGTTKAQTRNAEIAALEEGHCFLPMSESGWKYGMRSVDNVQKRRHGPGYKFWVDLPRGPVDHNKMEPGGTGLRGPVPHQYHDKQPDDLPWLFRGKAPIKRTLGWFETQKLGHSSHSHNMSRSRSSISCLS